MTSRQIINIYSDESRHLKNQGPCMVVGAMWCEQSLVPEVRDKIRLIKQKHSIASHREIKWTKVSKAKQGYYEDLVQLFFDTEGLSFRAMVIPTNQLQHNLFNQTPDEFYYKMQFTMLTNIIRKHTATFKIYLDYKDAWSPVRSQKLVEFLDHKLDFADREFFAQPIRSHESALMQLADLFIGAVAAKSNATNAPHTAKAALIALIEQNSQQALDKQTPYGVDKFNIFKWKPRTTSPPEE